jgi:DNA-binding NarL/FixJ family response regulator
VIGGPLPEITPRERDVLVALCRPATSSELFVEPSSVREIAGLLAVSEAAVKQHLLNLYEKFGIVDCEERRRVALAREAMRSGVVGVGDLQTFEYRTRVAGSAAS